MLSESARMSSATEAQFRIQAPNSRQRVTKVIALDRPSEGIVKTLAQRQWNNATFLTASRFAGAPQEGQRFSMQGWLSDLAGRTTDLVAEVDSADLVIMVATAGEDAQAASLIGEACSLKRVNTTALVLGSASHSDAEMAHTLGPLRPWSLMLVVSNAEEYIEDMLRALRA
jgi:hypothetical protein